jgi:aspartyl protease family protein
MRRLSSLLGLALLMLAANAVAGDVAVKVIALFTDKALFEVNGQQKIISKGETFDGVLLQSSSGRGAVVVIDGETMKLGINQSIAGNFKKRDKIRLRIVPDAQGMYYTRGSINGKSTNFLVDTGATNVALSGRKAASLRIDFTKGVRGQAQTAAGVVQAWNVKLDSVEVGGIRLNNVMATVIEGAHPAQVLLGNSFLRHTRMEQAGSVLEISKRY